MHLNPPGCTILKYTKRHINACAVRVFAQEAEERHPVPHAAGVDHHITPGNWLVCLFTARRLR